LRGSGRFDVAEARAEAYRNVFQSPSLRGSGRFPPHGGWAKEEPKFQSPSLRGSGRFRKTSTGSPLPPCGFQSPSLRGSGRFSSQTPSRCSSDSVSIPFIAGQWSLRRGGARRDPAQNRVSIPFIAGQWSLRTLVGLDWSKFDSSFNPLHCGAVVASGRTAETRRRPRQVSIPFIAGQWSLQEEACT